MQQQSAPEISSARIDDLDVLGRLFEAYRIFCHQPAAVAADLYRSAIARAKPWCWPRPNAAR